MIQELIIVEGKNDAHIVRKALGEVDILWTEGYGLSKDKLDYIKEMAQRRGVIVFTDPDTVGEQIREKIRNYIPEAKHVYIQQKVARKKGDIGVENASISAIKSAFANILIDNKSQAPTFGMEDIIRAGLSGKSDSAKRRSTVGLRLGIGDCNAKQFLHRLNRFGIAKEEFLQAIEEEGYGERC